MRALAEGRATRIDLMEDEAYFAYRLQMWYRETNGEEFCYESKPIRPQNNLELAQEAAKRIERLGVPRKYVKQWVESRFKNAKIDLSKVFNTTEQPPSGGS